MTVKVPITQAMWDKAISLQKTISETGLFKTANYTGLTMENRFVVGYAGELVVAAHFTNQGVRHVHRIVANGRSQKPEILGWFRGTPRLIEVKTGSQPHYKKVMWPVAQKFDGEYLVGVRINSHIEGEIMGFAPRSWIPHITTAAVVPATGILTRSGFYSDLTAIADMIEHMDKADGTPEAIQPSAALVVDVSEARKKLFSIVGIKKE